MTEGRGRIVERTRIDGEIYICDQNGGQMVMLNEVPSSFQTPSALAPLTRNV